jgi:hypothetical protein
MAKLITQKENVEWNIVQKGEEDFVATVYVDGEIVYQNAHCITKAEAREFVLAYLKKLVWDL